MNARWMGFVAVFLVLSVTGCQTLRQTPDDGDKRFLSVTNAALATARYAPTVNVTALVRGKSDAAGKGFAAGAGSCLHIMSGQSGGIAGGLAALATLICMPVAAVVGASKGSKEAAPIEDLEQGEARIHPTLESLSFQKDLGDHMIRYAAEAGLAPFILLNGQGPSRPEELPAYRPPDGRVLDAVIEVAITDITARTVGLRKLDYEFLLKARGRVVRAGDSTELDSFMKFIWTSGHPLEELLADGGKLLAAEFDHAYREIAEAFVDEWLLIDHRLRGAPGGKVFLGGLPGLDKDPEGQVEDRRLPAYMLYPAYPKLELAGFWRGIPPSHLGPLDPVRIDTLRPTLGWESFPRPDDFFDAATGRPDPRGVKYDLRIFRSRKFYHPDSPSPFLAPADTVYIERRGLAAPQFQPPAPLEPCTLYFWTIRARYVTEGRTRATEWSGAYNRGFYRTKPWLGRRSSSQPLALPNEFYFFPFETPPPEGKKCDAR